MSPTASAGRRTAGRRSAKCETSQRNLTHRSGHSIYTFNRAYWESRFYDEAYWTRYLDLLAQNRFNSLVVIFGYENGGFLAPCYPYFFDVDGFPDVRMAGSPRKSKNKISSLSIGSSRWPTTGDSSSPSESGTIFIVVGCKAVEFLERTTPQRSRLQVWFGG